MKLYSLLFTLLLSGLSLGLYAQQEKTVHFSEFKSYLINEKGVYYDRIKLNNRYDTAQIKFENFKSEQVTEAPPKGINIANGIPKPEFHFGIESKKMVAAFTIPLFYIQEGITYKVISFDAIINEKPESKVVARDYAANSVLSSGNWFKFAVDKRGVYKLDYNFLQSLGLNPSTINPANIRIYGNGGTVMNEMVNDEYPDDLFENAISVHSSGSTFGTNDYILMYANGPLLWKPSSDGVNFVHTQNYYENKSYYFITVDMGAGKRVQTVAPPTGTPALEINHFDNYSVIEEDTINLSQIGKVWHGHKIARNGYIEFPVNLPAVTDAVRYNVSIGGIVDAGNINLSMSYNGQMVANLPLIEPYNPNNYVYYRNSESSGTIGSNSNFTIRLNANASSINAHTYLNFLRFNFQSQLSYGNEAQFNFRSFGQKNANANSIVAYNIANSNAQSTVWDISNPLVPRQINGALSSGMYRFLAKGAQLDEYVAFSNAGFLTPSAIGKIDNQNLHALSQTDYLIITPEAFESAAQELAAFHRSKFNRSVHVVRTDKIYNEFSSGGQDISGIRDFIRMFYDRSTGDEVQLKNVLLFGAASFDYKDRINGNTNFVPTFQTLASSSGSAYITDEFFTLLDLNENIDDTINEGEFADVGIGRIPAKNLQEARDYIAKVMRYTSPETFGDWKLNTTFVSDDYEYNFYFLSSIEEMAGNLATTNRFFNQSKLYADASPRMATPSGTKFPAITRDINNQMINGTFLMNYIGHGSPDRWAVEEILHGGDVDQWNNANKLPIMITATCDFGRFDNPYLNAVGVQMVMKKDGGVIANLTTTQIVYEGANNRINEAYIKEQFAQKADGSYASFGEAFMEARNSLGGSSENTRKFVILGDPAISPALPSKKVYTTAMYEDRGNQELVATDTFKALGKYVIEGQVADMDGNPMTSFNGQVYLTIIDKEKTVSATNVALLADTRPIQQKDYKLQNNVLFKGNTVVENGVFKISLIIPKDINFDYGNGKLVFYAFDDKIEAAGVDETIKVGGFSSYAEIDNDGPIVKPYIDDSLFRSGDIVSANPLLYVTLEDNNGINVSGSSVGHDLIAVLDGDYENPYILNSFYNSAPNDYTKGSLYYQLTRLAPGKHTITVRAWDVYNNSGEGTIDFMVVDGKSLDFNLYNYPNPFSNSTNIVLQHNQPNVDMDVTLKIFQSNGKLVHNKTESIRPTGSFTQWTWNGTGTGGETVPNGAYFYQVTIKTSTGISKTLYQKLVFVR